MKCYFLTSLVTEAVSYFSALWALVGVFLVFSYTQSTVDLPTAVHLLRVLSNKGTDLTDVRFRWFRDKVAVVSSQLWSIGSHFVVIPG